MTAILTPPSLGQYTIDPLKQVERFLILGTEGGTYYTNERALTAHNIGAVKKAIATNGPAVVNLVIDISTLGRAPKQSATMFTLAAAHVFGDPVTRALARKAISQVCRTGSHLQEFVSFNQLLGKGNNHAWGYGLRKAVSNWYNNKPIKELSYQLAKYQSRYGVSHKDIIKLSHPNPNNGLDSLVRDNVYKYVIGKEEQPAGDFLVAMHQAHNGFDGTSAAVKAQFVRDNRLAHEMVPTEWKQDADVWAALLENMPLDAMVRNLGNMAKAGLLSKKSQSTQHILHELANIDRLKKSRLHPLRLLVAYNVYKSGHSVKGSGSWTPIPEITDALDAAFYSSFGNITPTDKRLLVAIDISASMCGHLVSGMEGVTTRIGAAAMAMLHLNTEPNVDLVGFSNELISLDLKPTMKLHEVSSYMDKIPFGGTRCELPMQYAMKNNKEYDAFIVYTDNETYSVHPPAEVLRDYRNKSGINSKLIVVGMTACDKTIADPNDPGMLDMVGFDASAHQSMSELIRS